MHNEITNDKHSDNIKLIMFFTVMTSIFLNHSNRDFGINISISDAFVIISMLLLIIKGKLVLPRYHTMFFMLLSIILLVTSFLYSPIKFGIDLNPGDIGKDYLKLFASFIFFLLGYNISRLKIMKINIKWYSIAALSISFIGFILKVLNINVLNSLMYFGGSRFRGLMIDPNYYSVIQCTALVYFLRKDNISKMNKVLIYLINFIFIAMSGSKTGMVTLVIYSLFIFVEYQVMIKKTTFKSILISLLFVISVIVLFPILIKIVNISLSKISVVFPIFTRVELLFENFSSAIIQGGSGRNITWISAIGIIKESPLLGVGLGSYIPINKIIFQSGSVAHNTYLQIFAEWGGIMSIFFFGYIFSRIIKVTSKAKQCNYDNELFILRDILIILLIGSLAISLNNARMFWMFFGGVIYKFKK